MSSEAAAPEIPAAVKDFVFDLHDACRRSQRPDEMKALYSGVFVELSLKHYTHKPWPSADEISSECESDEVRESRLIIPGRRTPFPSNPSLLPTPALHELLLRANHPPLVQ